MEKLNTLLRTLGVEKEAISLFVTLFRHGGLTVSEIAKRQKLHRPRVYILLGVLRDKGLLEEHLLGKRTLYLAVPPATLERMIETLLVSTKEMLPELETEYHKKNEEPSVVVLHGREGVTEVFRDLVNTTARGETFYRYSSEVSLEKTNKYLPREYRATRDAKKLERFVITAPRIGRGKKARLERAMKYVPEGFDLFEQNIVELLYANKVAFIDLNAETSIVIENARLADFHKKMFRLLYQKL